MSMVQAALLKPHPANLNDQILLPVHEYQYIIIRVIYLTWRASTVKTSITDCGMFYATSRPVFKKYGRCYAVFVVKT